MSDWKKYSEEPTPSTTNYTTTEANKYRTASFVLGFLIVAIAATAVILGIKSNDYQAQNTSLTSKVADLNTIQGDLQTELTSLESEYDTRIEENEGLKVTIEERVQEINNLQSKIKQVRNQLKNSEANTAEMENRLTQLEELKVALQSDVMNLKGENANLMAAKEELNESLTTREATIEELQGKIVALSSENEKIQNHLFKVAPAGYRAGNFSVDVEKRNDKLTAKARQAKEIKVNFDLPNVPQEKQGKAEIYLVVTDIHGNALKEVMSNPISVPSANEYLKVDAVDIEEIDLNENQSLTLSFKPEDKMDAGEYNLMVYSDDGYLGAVGLSLR